ncbi:MAG: hypothetical protein ACKVT0_02385 [Planctomycetaceae bacterium]
MTFGKFQVRLAFGLLCGLTIPMVTTGCQTTVGGQTLPSAYFLTDDVQYFPSGPEFLLTKQDQAMKDYQAQRDAEATEEAP